MRVVAMMVAAAVTVTGCASTSPARTHATTPKLITSPPAGDPRPIDTRRLRAAIPRASEIGRGFTLIPQHDFKPSASGPFGSKPLDSFTTPPRVLALSSMNFDNVRTIRVCHNRFANLDEPVKIIRPVYVQWRSAKLGLFDDTYAVAGAVFPTSQAAEREFASLKDFIICPPTKETQTDSTHWATRPVAQGRWTGVDAVQTDRAKYLRTGNITIDNNDYLIYRNVIIATMYSARNPATVTQATGTARRLLNVLITRLGT